MSDLHPFLLRLHDISAAALSGAVAAVTAWWLFPSDWPMMATMPLSMIVGMVAALPVIIVFNLTLVGFEVVMPPMQAGMMAGMAGVMIHGASLTSIALYGLLIGALVYSAMSLLDLAVRGEVDLSGREGEGS